MRIKKQAERWFDIPNDPDEGQILVKHLNPGEITDIMDEVFTQTIVYKADGDQEPQPEFMQETNRRKDREKTLMAAVVGWKKFYDQEGKVLKCTPENVIRASREIEGFDICPCAGTHVRATGELGTMEILKKENKGRDRERIVYTLK